MNSNPLSDREVFGLVCQAFEAKTKRKEPNLTEISAGDGWKVVRASDGWGHWYFAVEARGQKKNVWMILSVLPRAKHVEANDRIFDIAKEKEEAAEYDHENWDLIVAEWSYSPTAFLSFFGSPDPTPGSSDIWVKYFDEWSMQTFYRQMRTMIGMNTGKPINLMISSRGGNPLSMLAMADFARLSSAQVRTVVTDLAASCGGYMLGLAGSEGMRFAMPSATILIHGISAGTAGKIPDMKGDVRFFEKLENRVLNQLALRTKLSADEWKKKIQGVDDEGVREIWLSAEEALEYGLIDSIISEDSFGEIFG